MNSHQQTHWKIFRHYNVTRFDREEHRCPDRSKKAFTLITGLDRIHSIKKHAVITCRRIDNRIQENEYERTNQMIEILLGIWYLINKENRFHYGKPNG